MGRKLKRGGQVAYLYGYNQLLVMFLRENEVQEGPPGQYDDVLRFDEDTNPDVVSGILAAWDAHRLVDGELRRNGQPVPINLPGESYKEALQAEQVKNVVRHYLTGLGDLGIVDFGYAYTARLLALANGEDDATIFAIDDRASATSYVAGMSQWAELPASVRQWLVVDLESRAYDAMVIRVLLVDR